MKYSILAIVFLIPVLLAAQDIASYDELGQVTVYHSPTNTCAAVVVSGAEGWKGQVVDIAKRLFSEQNCFVLGVDLNVYQSTLKEKQRLCPGSDFVRGSLHFEKIFQVKKYVAPVLVGYREGSAMTYLALSEMADAYAGGFSFGFCPDVAKYRRPCKEAGMDVKHIKDGAMALLPDPGLDAPLFVLAHERVPGCSMQSVADFLKQIKTATLLQPEKDWLPQFTAAADQMKKHGFPAPTVVSDLPLIEYPSQEQDTLAIILSGDGGWGDLGRDIGDHLVARKYAVVGFDTLQYYWNERDPNLSASDMNRVIHGYLAAWNKQKVLLIGYSFGADVLPFMLRKMPEETRKKVAGVVLIGPSTKTRFEFNVSELERDPGPPVGEPLQPELKHLKDTRVLCIGGFREKESLCRHILNSKVKIPTVQIEMMDTGHSFGNDPNAMAEHVLEKLIH